MSPSAPPSALPRAVRPVPRVDGSLPPRKAFFAEPDRVDVKLSHDGKFISFIADDAGVPNVWIASAEVPGDAKPITQSKQPIGTYEWAYDNIHVLYQREAKDDEESHLFAVNTKTAETRDLTPYGKARIDGLTLSPKHPAAVAVGLNDRDPEVHDVYRVDLGNAKRTLLIENREGFSGFVIDQNLEVRLAKKDLAGGSQELLKRGKDGRFVPFMKAQREVDGMSTTPWAFDASGSTLYVADGDGRNTTGAFAVDIASGKRTLLVEEPLADVGAPLLHPASGKVQGAAFAYERTEWKVIDKSLEADFEYLETVAKGDLEILSRSLDDKRWLVSYATDSGPVRHFLYDRGAKKKATFLFVDSKDLESLTLAPMLPRVIKARDGLALVSYITLPNATDPDRDGSPNAPAPLVLIVHQGPWWRDAWRYNEIHQWLASRGYAVLSVNFRGSAGFGKTFLDAGNGEWGGKMQDDLLDAVDWAVREGIAAKDKVAIFGYSYGGYAALVGATMTPERFACAVDLNGGSNLESMIDHSPELEPSIRRIGGDPRTPEGRKFLASRSPITFVHQIRHPLLIGQGAKDQTIRQEDTDRLVKALQSQGTPVSYALFPDGTHDSWRREDLLAFTAAVEPFLAQCLGGAYEPVGDDFKGSSITFPIGADEIAGVADALK